MSTTYLLYGLQILTDMYVLDIHVYLLIFSGLTEFSYGKCLPVDSGHTQTSITMR